MSERLIAIDGLELCAEAFGDPADPPMILIMGAQASMLWWPEDLCRQLADHGFHVIRYDHRDVGRSTSYGIGQADYAIGDLARDVLRVMEGFGAARAHLVGFSMGGYLAQAVAISDPGRVLSLAVWGSGPLDEVAGLGEMDAGLLEFLMTAMPQDWTDEAAVVAFHVEGARRMRGDRFPFDEQAQTALARAEFRRARDRASALNHARYDTTHPGGGASIAVPTLVLHGEADPVTPVDHAHGLAEIVPDARLQTFPGVGHELPPGLWDEAIAAIVANARR